MSEAHCNNLAQRKALGLVTHDNTGGPFVVECQGCGEVYPSFHCIGGGQIADTGDCEDARCPHCDQVDPEECDNAALAWNTQQLKINELQLRLNAADQRLDDAAHYMRRTVDLVMQGCGNSYANAWCEKLLVIAKSFGAYNGATIGNIVDLREALQTAEDGQ